MILALILQAASAGAPAALAAPESATATAKPAIVASASAVDPNKKICKSEEVTGSRVGGLRVCMTKAQWDERAAQAGAQLNSYQMSGMATSMPH